MKTAIMRNGKKLKGSQIFVNEDMTRIRGKIAWEACQLCRDGKVLDTWTRDGIIFVKKTKQYKVLHRCPCVEIVRGTTVKYQISPNTCELLNCIAKRTFVTT